MANLFPPNDDQFSVGLGNFITVANDNLATVGLTAADITALTASKTGLETNIAASQAAKDSAKAATAGKKTSRLDANDTLRAAIKKVEATPNVPDALIKQLGMNVRDGKPSPVQPTTPFDLAAYGDDKGNNLLTWNTNGNKSGTIYIIEARIGDAASFAWIANATKAKYKNTGQTPGQKVAYRVKASRPAGESDWSNVAVVYDIALPLAA